MSSRNLMTDVVVEELRRSAAPPLSPSTSSAPQPVSPSPRQPLGPSGPQPLSAISEVSLSAPQLPSPSNAQPLSPSSSIYSCSSNQNRQLLARASRPIGEVVTSRKLRSAFNDGDEPGFEDFTWNRPSSRSHSNLTSVEHLSTSASNAFGALTERSRMAWKRKEIQEMLETRRKAQDLETELVSRRKAVMLASQIQEAHKKQFEATMLQTKLKEERFNALHQQQLEFKVMALSVASKHHEITNIGKTASMLNSAAPSLNTDSEES